MAFNSIKDYHEIKDHLKETVLLTFQFHQGLSNLYVNEDEFGFAQVFQFHQGLSIPRRRLRHALYIRAFNSIKDYLSLSSLQTTYRPISFNSIKDYQV